MLLAGLQFIKATCRLHNTYIGVVVRGCTESLHAPIDLRNDVNERCLNS